MSRAPTLGAIDCTACGAGLDILGGGRVTTHICPYCGTELDALDGYKALRKFSNVERPDTPFALGSHGTLHDVQWTVVGILAHRETWAGKSWEWVDHQLYSATHGYAWLTLEDGHLTFARRVRGVRSNLWIGTRWVETAETPPKVSMNGESFKYLQTSTSSVIFAEGEFTWSPSNGEQTTSVSAISDGAMLDFAQTGQEREIHRITYLDGPETLAAFGLDPEALSPRGVHAVQPYKGWSETRFLTRASLTFAAVALVLAVLLSFWPGRTVLDPVTVGFSQLPRDVSIEITDPKRRLAGIYLSSNVSNSWAYVDLELYDPNDELLFEAGRTMEYYFGTDADGSWTEGNRSASLYFLPTVPGTYTLTLSAVEQGTWGSGGRDASRVEVSARTGMASGWYLYLLAIGFALFAALFGAGRFIHNRRRWAHSDWSDD